MASSSTNGLPHTIGARGNAGNAWCVRGRTVRWLEPLILGGSLIVAAYLTSVAVSLPRYSWIGWVTLFPLLVAIRVQRPTAALVSGTVWGVALYAFLGTRGIGAAGGIESLALLTLAPAIYTYLGAWLTRRIGFSPLVLGVGWMFVELALAPLGLQHGLLAGTQDGGWLLQVLGHVLGYVLVAFLIAYLSALLVTALTEVRIRVPSTRRILSAAERAVRFGPQTFFCLPLFCIRLCRPRGPPVHV